MAHDLATINGKIAMAYQGETPWHRLGTMIDSSADVAAAMRAASLDWTVSLQPLTLPDGTRSPFSQAVMRETAERVHLADVGPAYTLIQNADAFAPLQAACDHHGVTIEAAGALGNGARVWALGKLPGAIQPVPGDTVNGYFLFATGHDGSFSCRARLTPIRVVCQNTLTAAIDGQTKDDQILIRHTATADTRIKQATRMVDGLMKALKQTGDTFAALAARRMSKADVIQYIESVFPPPADQAPGAEVSKALMERRAMVAQLVWTGTGAQLAGSDASGTTAWACYNAVTEYFDHVRPGLTTTPGALRSADESAAFGGNLTVKVKALQAARQLVAA